MRTLLLLSALIVSTTGCTRAPSSSQTGHTDATTRPSQPALVPTSSAPVAKPTTSAPAPAPSPATALSASPSASASSAPTAQPSQPPAPLPDVQVKNIGMHIGGGPNDRKSKAPIAQSVKPHFDELRACWRFADDQTKGGTFGVDLLIPRAGGKAEASHPRSAIKGDGFEKCVLDVFAGIEFKRPRTGKTMVSYSLRFTPGK